MNRSVLGAALVAITALNACGVDENEQLPQNPDPTSSSVGPTWNEFRHGGAVFAEPGSGVLIADGDTPFSSEAQLRDFYQTNLQWGQLSVNKLATSSDDFWDATASQNITYCISNEFGDVRPKIVAALTEAISDWMNAANIRYVHVESEDANCNTANSNVVFDVRPIDVRGKYLARAFYPSMPREKRSLVVDKSAWNSQTISLAGVMRHELGHTLGFRHEHTRPEAGKCFEDSNWDSLTDYDSASVMHYPQCQGTGSWGIMALTANDRLGVALAYGLPRPADENPQQ